MNNQKQSDQYFYYQRIFNKFIAKKMSKAFHVLGLSINRLKFKYFGKCFEYKCSRVSFGHKHFSVASKTRASTFWNLGACDRTTYSLMVNSMSQLKIRHLIYEMNIFNLRKFYLLKMMP